MKFSDFCEKINNSFSIKKKQYTFIYELFNALESEKFKNEFESDQSYASKLYSETDGRSFKNARKDIPTPLKEKKIIKFFNDNLKDDLDDVFKLLEIKQTAKDRDILCCSIVVLIKEMMTSEQGTSLSSFNGAYQKILSQKGIAKPVYKEYLKKAREKIRRVKTILYDDIDFYDIYIANDLSVHKRPQGYEGIFVHDEKLSGQYSSTKSFIEKYGHFISISAPGGYGKSMFMKHLFLCDSLCTDYPSILPSNLIPVLVYAKQYKGSTKKLLNLVYESITAYVDLDYNEFLSDLNKGYFILLFDGLDEIKFSLQLEFFDELNNLSTKYSENYFITTARPSEFMINQIGYKDLFLEGLSFDRAKQMILKKTPNYADDLKKQFVEDLEFSWYNFRSICENPLLLNVMFLVYEARGRKLPINLYEFYDNTYEVMYEKHNLVQNHKREYKTKLSKNQLKDLISEFCFKLYEKQEYEFDIREATRIINSSQKFNNISVDDFLFDFSNNLNIIYLEDDKYKFIHRLFQEYFTANHLSILPDNEYDKLIDWFTNIASSKSKFIFSTRGSNVLEMLYEMDTDRCLKKIIKPVLKNYISESYTKAGLLNYLNKSIDSIIISEQSWSSFNNKLLDIICSALHISSDFSIKLTEELKESIDPSYIYDYIIYEIAEPDDPKCSSCYPVSKSYVDSQLDKARSQAEMDEILSTIVDYTDEDTPEYSIPPQDLIDEPEKFKLLIDIICGDESVFKKNHQALYKILYK